MQHYSRYRTTWDYYSLRSYSAIEELNELNVKQRTVYVAPHTTYPPYIYQNIREKYVVSSRVLLGDEQRYSSIQLKRR